MVLMVKNQVKVKTPGKSVTALPKVYIYHPARRRPGSTNLQMTRPINE
jgi:hypothetical protein